MRECVRPSRLTTAARLSRSGGPGHSSGTHVSRGAHPLAALRDVLQPDLCPTRAPATGRPRPSSAPSLMMLFARERHKSRGRAAPPLATVDRDGRATSDAVASPALMALRPLLAHLADDPDGATLVADGGRAFVSRRCARTSSRRWPTAAAADRPRSSSPATTARRATSPPTCAPGSRRARCASTRAAASPTSRTSRRRRTSSACASPRSTRCSPSAPTREEPPVVVVTAVALSEKVPDPALRPHSFTLRVGDLLDLDEVGRRARGRRLRARRPGRRPRPVRDPRRDPRRLPGDRGPRGARRPVRHRDRVAALVLDLHPAHARRDRRRRDRAGGRARRRASRAGRDRRARGRRGPPRRRRAAAGRPLPRLPRPRAGRRGDPASPPRRRSRPALADHWQDVCAAFHDEDAHHLYVKPDDDRAPRSTRARASA